MKKILVIMLTLIIIILIFVFTRDKKIYYLAIGDDLNFIQLTNRMKKYYQENNLYENSVNYIKDNYRSTDFINDINDNIKINNKITLNNALIKADIITIMAGSNDYLSYINDLDTLNNNLVDLKYDMEKFLKTLKNISKEKIIFIGIFNFYPDNTRLDQILRRLNEMYSNLCAEYNIYYLDIYNLDIYNDLNNYIYLNHFTSEGYQIIFNKLIKELDNVIIE